MSPTELLAARYGVFVHAEAALFGVRERRGGRVDGHRMLPGVYSLLPPPWRPEARWTAAGLAGGPGSVLVGDAWLQACGLQDTGGHAAVEMLIPDGSRRVDAGFVRYRRSRATTAASHGVRQRLPRALAPDVGVAAAGPGLAYLARSYPREEIRAALATLCQRRLAAVEDVAGWAAAWPRVAGAGTVAWAAQQLGGGLQSEGEVRLHQLSAAVGFPPNGTQLRIFAGPSLASVTDAWWRDGVAGYFDGAVHMQHAAHQRDIAIRERLRTAGVVVFEATGRTLGDRRGFERALATRLQQARDGVAGRRWRMTGRGLELDPGF